MDWSPILSILLAVGLSLVIGIEREFYSKSAGIRTYTLVGLGSALFTVVSKYGFLDTVMNDTSRFDGSRVAAQVVTGIGFLGAGLIFVRRDSVRGLTTAAGVWFVAAVGMAAGSGLHVIAAVVTGLYVAIMLGIRPISRHMPHAKSTLGLYVVRYVDGHGVLRDVMETISQAGLKVGDLRVLGAVEGQGDTKLQDVALELEGSSVTLATLPDELNRISGVQSVTSQMDERRARSSLSESDAPES